MASKQHMRVCTACSAENAESSGRYCPECGAAMPEAVADPTAATAVIGPDASGSLIGMTVDAQFVIDAVLGGGSFGTVYRGRQLGLDRPVALKVPTAEISTDPVMSRRFAREARSAARIHHPGVVAIYAVGNLPDTRPYLAMELIDGRPLDSILAEGPVPPLRALAITRDVASALSETHAAGVIHRDLKPSNIVWRRDRNGDDRITLVDFGIAMCKPGNADASRLTANGLIGTPHYMSPEQAHGDTVDHRSDLYALGCILFELVTGETPFDGSGFEVLLAHLGRPVPTPSERKPGTPAVVDHIIKRLLAKKPEQRYQSADELVIRLDDAIAEVKGQELLDPAKPAAKPKPTLVEPDSLDDSYLPSDSSASSGSRASDDELGSSAVTTTRRSRGFLAGAIVGLAVAGAGFAAYQLTRSDPSAVPDDPPDPDPAVASDDPARITLAADNGTMTMKLTVPDPIIVRAEVNARIELWDKLGRPVTAESVVVTIEDPTGSARGFAAAPRRKPGNFGFRYAFPREGDYVIHVFPSSGDGDIQATVHAIR